MVTGDYEMMKQCYIIRTGEDETGLLFVLNKTYFEGSSVITAETCRARADINR